MAHAVAEFAFHAPHDFEAWRNHSNYVIVLEVPSTEILQLLEESSTLPTIDVREPDLEDELTALAFIPSPLVKSALANLPLAGKHFRKPTTTEMVSVAKKGETHGF